MYFHSTNIYQCLLSAFGVYLQSFSSQSLTVCCREVKIQVQMPAEGANTGSCSSLRPHSSSQITEFSFPDYLKSLGTSGRHHPSPDSQLWEQPECWGLDLEHITGLLASPSTPTPAISPPRHLELPLPLSACLLGFSSPWVHSALPVALLTPPPLAAPASSAFLWEPHKVVELTKVRVSGVYSSLCAAAPLGLRPALHCILIWANYPGPSVSPKKNGSNNST